MNFEQVDLWARLTDLINNRVSVGNQLLGARYDGCKDNPLQLKYERGRYSCMLCGEVYAFWGVYDLDATQTAFERIDALVDGLWLIGRSGFGNLNKRHSD